MGVGKVGYIRAITKHSKFLRSRLGINGTNEKDRIREREGDAIKLKYVLGGGARKAPTRYWEKHTEGYLSKRTSALSNAGEPLGSADRQRNKSSKKEKAAPRRITRSSKAGVKLEEKNFSSED